MELLAIYCPQLLTGFGFINTSGAYESFNALYGELVKPTAPLIGNNDNIVDFNQKEFWNSIMYTLDNDGYLHVTCSIVPSADPPAEMVMFNVDSASPSTDYFRTYVQKGYMTKTGYMDVAEINNIIISAPLVNTILNPAHCWDCFGYTGLNYGNREGYQIRSVYKMLRRIVDGV